MTSTSQKEKTKILVAEDEKDIRELVSITMRLAGYEVWTANDGQEALTLAREVLPDLILMDVRMPRMTGYEACRVLKKEEPTQHIPIVFLSAKGQEAEIKQGMELGAVDYILKPFETGDLPKRMAEILREATRRKK